MNKLIARHRSQPGGSEIHHAGILQGMADDQYCSNSHHRRMTESGKSRLHRHQTQQRAQHQRRHGDEIMAPAPPGKHQQHQDQHRRDQ